MQLIIKFIMKISNLGTELIFPNKIGQTLAPEERIKLDLAVSQLSGQYHCEMFLFWGRVEGVHKNYYVVQGLTLKGAVSFPRKQYFWSSDDFKFAQLPAPRLDFLARVCRMDDYFTGQHEKIIFKGVQDASRGKNFTQLDRLSIVVHQIEEDCQVVPLGAYKMIPTKQLVLNPNFKGLKLDQSRDLSNYVHIRPPIIPAKQLLIDSGKAFDIDTFLDPLSEDKVQKGWSLQTDQSRTEITVRSLVWPGYVGYHRTNSSIFGGVYMGSGIRCQDLPFLI